MITPRLMRWLDRAVGAPVCWLLARRPFRRRPDANPSALPRRVLFIQLAESGSMVLADPAMAALGERTGAAVYVLTFDRNRAALGIVGRVPAPQVFALRTGSLPQLLRDCGRFLRWVRRERIDAVVDLELFTRLSALLFAFSGVGRGVGFARQDGGGPYAGWADVRGVECNPHQHMAVNYRRLVDALLLPPGVALQPAPAALPWSGLQVPRRVLAADESARVAALLDAVLPPAQRQAPLLLVNPNASGLLPQRRWPAAHFVALIGRVLAACPARAVALIGADEDRGVTAAIAAEIADARCVDLAGQVALTDLPALYAVASVLLSNDSGPAHFAAVTALPTVVLFGPETPVRYRPLGNATVLSADLPCAPCVSAENQRQTTCRDNRCLQALGVERVLAAVSECLPPATARVIALSARPAAASLPQRSVA